MNFISKLLYSLKSEKAKLRDMDKSFRSVTESEPLPLSLGEKIGAWFVREWKWSVGIAVTILLAILFKR